MKDGKENTRKRRGATKGSPKEERSMPDTMGDLPTGSGNEYDRMCPMSGFLLRPITFGKMTEPEGRDAYYWERAKAELTQLQKEGHLPTGRTF